MRTLFPWRRRNGSDRADVESARQGLADEVARLEETRSQTPRYKALADALREVRERNHLGEAIAHTFRGGNP